VTALTGTGKLVRLILRRDRLIMPLWILGLCIAPVGLGSSINNLFPTAAGRQQYHDASVSNATFTALYGRLSGSSLGELVSWRSGFVPVMVGLVSLLTVIRHTRTEEEAGRRELVGSTVVGRHAGLAAALIATVGANLVLGALLALGVMGQHLPAGGSLMFGVEMVVAGTVFAAIGGVTAQLTDGAGAARGIGVTILGAAYLLRVVGDVSAQSGGAFGWLSWLSPIGWAHRVNPYATVNWWPVALAVIFSAVLMAAAVALSARRDVGAGVFPPRLGPAEAAPGLRSPLGLAWRLHRALLAGWTIGFAVLGLVFGGVAKGIGDLVGDNPRLADMFARMGGRTGLIDSFLAGIMGLSGLIAAAYGIQAALRLRAEETATRAEPVLATAVGRLRWAGSHLFFSALGPAAALAAVGLTGGLTHGLNTGNVGRELPRVLAGALVQLPAVWVLAAIAVALTGLLPRLAAASWGAFAVCLLIGLVGAALELNHWLLDVSPFTHVPKVPGGNVSAVPLLWLGAAVVAFTAAGLVGLRRRDIPVI
jgi:ABC-2 type transport system permease protein